ncbi:MAG: prepilin-type N-terminal cleavage/methylation domain-containing protein [Methylococcaceae bacterium]
MRHKLTGFRTDVRIKSQLQSGMTLIELILSMVIISVALTGVLTVMNYTVRHSADPVIQHQAIAIAESYLEEVLLHAYANPTGGYSGTDRSQFDDVDDYNSLSDTGVKDHLGNSVAILTKYNVAVSVSSPVTLTGSVLAKKVTVTVSGLGISLKLVGYRANY